MVAELSKLSDEELLAGIGRAFEVNKLACYTPYEWQSEFHNLGHFAKERLVIAANGPGKSYCVFAEVAMHATGQYPDWWQGARFDQGGFEIWVGSIDSDMQKKAPQPLLLGDDLDDMLGTGWLPLGKIKKINRRQAGIKDVVDEVFVEHISGKPVKISFLTFEQGEKKWQSGAPLVIAIDEEPDESNIEQKGIFSEILTRLVRSGGIFLGARTPLYGETALIRHFINSDDPGVRYVTATWDDAPHMTDEDKERALRGYPEHERETRSKGVIMLGEGAVFGVSESQFVIDPIQLADHWARIKGIDFGLAHPAATVELAWDRDNDIVYIVDAWRDTIDRSARHIEQINSRNEWIPVAWPHDGEKRDPKSGVQLHAHFKQKGCRMLSRSARFKNDTGGPQSQWKIIEEVRDRLATGRLQVFRTCKPWLEEYRSFHTKDGVIVARRDDALKASFYALMMLRFARSKSQSMSEGAEQMTMAPFTTAA